MLVQFLHAKQSVDDVMWGSVQHKLENLGQVLDGHAGESLEIHDDQTHRAKYRPPSGADRSPGGGPLNRAFGGQSSGGGRSTQATLDGFMAKSSDDTLADIKRAQEREMGHEDANKRPRH